MSSLLEMLSTIVVSICCSISATTMVVLAIIHRMIPRAVTKFMAYKISEYVAFQVPSEFTFVIEQGCEAVNETYQAVEAYLPALVASSTDALVVGSNTDFQAYVPSLPKFEFAIPFGAKVKDNFQGMLLEWSIHCKEARKCYYNDEKSFQLTCQRKDLHTVLEKYFPHVSQTVQSLLNKREKLYIHTYIQEYGMWESTIFNHKSTFDSLAMEPELKQSVIADLKTFVDGRDLLDNVGMRARKRRYLLHGPTGTGKTSLVAAIANYLRFNVYDIRLQSIRSDDDLKYALTSIRSRSILLIENVDCCLEEEDDDQTNYKLTVSSLLDLTDSLWSCDEEERIIIFTTDRKDKLDPALLRPGRMDFQIEMGYCTVEVFKMLAKIYRIEHECHEIFGKIENLIQKLKVTPAEIAEYFLRYDFPRLALEHLLVYLKKKEAEAEKKRMWILRSEGKK